MNETSHDNLQYTGDPNSNVRINVTPQGPLVTWTLNNVTQPAGTPIRFQLGSSSGDITRVQLNLDFNAEGSYEYEIEDVIDCTEDDEHLGTCKHTREGPPLVIENFTFVVV